MPDAIEVNNLVKEYGSLKAVDDVSLTVRQGTIFGLLGPNGAGKTTLISMLVTMRRPTSGKAKVNGFDVQHEPDKVRKSIGIVFQDPSLDDELTAKENLDMHASMYGVPKDKREAKVRELMGIVGLQDKLDVQVKKFSGGMKRRLEIARGLLHEPKVLFLDEPTIGLDPQTRAGIWDYVTRLNREKGVTIIMTTHYMDEADRVCNSMAIIDNGKIIASGTPEALKNALGGDVISIKCGDDDKCAESLSKLKWVKSTLKHDGFIDVRVDRGEERIPKVLQLMEKQGILVESVNLRKPSLDDVFLHYTGKTIREGEASPRDAMRLRRKAWGRR
jgi:ABC-2 type transport system ATP-binding protein